MRNPRIAVAALTLVALACRIQLTYGSGIWADEGMALSVVAIPSLGGMIDFLRFHESHPPLFYLMVRAWRGIAGTSDWAVFSLMLLISTLLVPATYAVARSFLSARASIIAASLVAVSPAIAEHSSQVRPYGLMHLLVLFSCYLLAKAIEQGRVRLWISYTVVTALLLYTHNWGWLVFGGQAVASVVALSGVGSGERRQRYIEAGLAMAAVLLLYLPWFPALLFQSIHAGHTGLQLDSAADLLDFGLFALVSIPDYLLLGLYPRNPLSLVLVAGAAAGLVVLFTALVPGAADRLLRSDGNGDGSLNRQSPLQLFLAITILALAGAVIFSPLTTLFIQRCVAMLTPLVLIWVAAAFDRMLVKRDNQRFVSLGIGLLTFLVILEVTAILSLLPTRRSNSREVASIILSHMRSDDMLITAPEWFAPSFNHYFPPSIEQHDHPQAGRSGPVDFTSAQRRSLDSAATARLARVIAEARGSGRRVWLVSERTYLRYADDVVPGLVGEAELDRYAPVRRAREARDLLANAYGPPDTTHFVHGRVSRYDELLPMLFQPAQSIRSF